MKVVPEKDMAPFLPLVENPARYVGGEFGCVRKPDAPFRVAVCFPDLYEIGMSNQAVAVLYGLLNALDGVACERVFAPAEDFEALLRDKNIPLYGLESGTPLDRFDIVAFTVGYELCATNILAVLETGRVPLLNAERGPGDPIVIAGGPAITNPLPFGAFIDAVYIGEAEEHLQSLVRELAEGKKRGLSREELLKSIIKHTFIWHSGTPAPARRAVWTGFSASPSPASLFPVPSIRTVQDHGVVEIMRGCPHGCRFCHAGIYYRPYRMKDSSRIIDEVDELVHRKGYREITLSSLSSGDYTGLAGLVRILNEKHVKDYVSFSLPSLHLETFGLRLLSEISSTRKSGLTFAVETPSSEFQLALNKEAPLDTIADVLREAGRLGWRSAKLYFMIGLPFAGDTDEAGGIARFVAALHEKTGFHLNVNIGTFIPKPHTPYQWSFQLTEEQSLERIVGIKKSLSRFPAVKVSYHSPFQSYLEGVISRGDGRAGDLILAAFRRGARFDSWEDRSSADVWRTVLAEADWDVETLTCGQRPVDAVLPWQNQIDLGVTRKFLLSELEKHRSRFLTGPCAGDCDHPCGCCTSKQKPVDEKGEFPDVSPGIPPEKSGAKRTFFRCFCRYSKTGKAAFLPHLSLLTVMERSLLRSGFRPRFTEGFNPKPVLEFAQPLPVGMSSCDELFSFDSEISPVPEDFIPRMNKKLPDGLTVTGVEILSFVEGEKKPASLMSRYGGGKYLIEFRTEGSLPEILSRLQSVPRVVVANRSARELEIDFHSEENGRGFVSVFKEIVGPVVTESYSVSKIKTFLR